MLGWLQSPALDAALSYGGVGVTLALCLIVLCRLLLPAGGDGKRLTRAPVLLLLSHVVLVGLRTAVHTGTGHTLLGVAATLLLLVATGRALTVLALDVVLGHRLKRPAPKIFRDIVEGLMYVAAGLLTLRSAGVDPGSLLTTSALLTAIIGLSLQDTLGNVFAGLALQTEHPFGLGDWIRFDDKPEHIGQVVEINWRATKVRTRDMVELTIPNGLISRASIVNYSRPTQMTRRTVDVDVARSHPPQAVQRCISDALRGCEELLPTPAPTVTTQAFGDSGIRYRVRFFSENLRRPDLVEGRVRDRAWYALRRAGFALSVPLRDVSVQTRATVEAADHLPAARALLAGIEFLNDLSEQDLAALADGSEVLLYGAGEDVVRQGDQGESLFVCMDGELAVLHVDGRGRETELSRMQTAGLFGELSVMTGQPRAATIRALRPTELLRLDRAAFKAVLDRNPTLAESLSARLVQRQDELDALGPDLHRTMGPHTPQDDQGALLKRIKEFFTL